MTGVAIFMTGSAAYLTSLDTARDLAAALRYLYIVHE